MEAKHVEDRFHYLFETVAKEAVGYIGEEIEEVACCEYGG